jgi:hypothetical protein
MNKSILCTFIVCLSLLVGACHKADESVTNSAPSKPAASPLVGFAKDLQFIKNGQYTYIFVLARKDGKNLDSEDKEYLRKNVPQIVDLVTTEEGKKAIIGTNFDLEDGPMMAALKKRYVVEDYSAK